MRTLKCVLPEGLALGLHNLQRFQVLEREKLRLVMLFALRYERDGRTHVGQLLQTLGGAKNNEVLLLLLPVATNFSLRILQNLVNGLLSLCGESKRTGDLFGNKNIVSRGLKLLGGLKVRTPLFLLYIYFTRFFEGGRECIHPTPAATVQHHR